MGFLVREICLKMIDGAAVAEWSYDEWWLLLWCWLGYLSIR
jgi:hypothetical protein